MDDKFKLVERSLRAKAISKLQKKKVIHDNLSVLELSHELSVNEIELEMQNEELLLAQSKLNASLIEYAELFEYSPIGYYILDDNGIIKHLNLHACIQLKSSKQSIIGKTFAFFLNNEVCQDNFYLHRLSVKESGTIQHLNAIMKRTDGVLFDVLIKSIEVKDEKQSFKHFLCMVTDISFIKEQEAQIKLALDKANKLNEMQSRFIALASHEFRTPLTSILTCTWLVEQYAKSGKMLEMKEYASRVRISVRQLTQILDEFLSQEKLGDGSIKVVNNLFNLKEFCEGLLVDIRISLKSCDSINFTFVGEKEIDTDKKILYHILINLLSNSVKYAGEKKKIEFSVEVTDSSILIYVKDNGIGIPDIDKPFIFSRFFRAQNTVSKQGTGLGLSIVKDYVNLLNGNISFESSEGVGTTFFLEIPIVKINSLMI